MGAGLAAQQGSTGLNGAPTGLNGDQQHASACRPVAV